MASSPIGCWPRSPRCSARSASPGEGVAFGYGSVERHGQAAARGAVLLHARRAQPDRRLHPGRARHRHAGEPRRRLRLQRPRADLPRYAHHLVGRRQSRSTTTRTSTACCAPGRRPRPSSCRSSTWTAARAPRRHRAAGDHHAGAQRHRQLRPRPLRARHAPGDRPGRPGAQRPRHPGRHRRGARLPRPLHRAAQRGCLAAPPVRTAGARTARASASRRPISTASGPKGWWEADAPPRGEEYTQFADFRADPEEHPLDTPTGKVELFSETIASFGYDDAPGHPVWIEPREWLGAAQAAALPAAPAVLPARDAAAWPARPRARGGGRQDRRGASPSR